MTFPTIPVTLAVEVGPGSLDALLPRRCADLAAVTGDTAADPGPA